MVAREACGMYGIALLYVGSQGLRHTILSKDWNKVGSLQGVVGTESMREESVIKARMC